MVGRDGQCDRLAGQWGEPHTGPVTAGQGDESEVEASLAHLIGDRARAAGMPDGHGHVRALLPERSEHTRHIEGVHRLRLHRAEYYGPTEPIPGLINGITSGSCGSERPASLG